MCVSNITVMDVSFCKNTFNEQKAQIKEKIKKS